MENKYVFIASKCYKLPLRAGVGEADEERYFNCCKSITTSGR